MHMVISAIVPGETKEVAVANATDIFERLCGDTHPFDYYTLITENSRGVAARVTSKMGKKAISDGMKATKDEFYGNIAKIRKILANHTDQEILEGTLVDVSSRMAHTLDDSSTALQELYMARYYMYCCGRYEGPSIWLYDEHGSGIRTSADLGGAIKSVGKNGWVVPADVHF